MREGSFEWYKALFNQIMKGDMDNYNTLFDIYQVLLNMRVSQLYKDKDIRRYAANISREAHRHADIMAAKTGQASFDDIYWKFLLFEAPELFESYLIYMEKNRDPAKRFYEPRMRTLHVLVNELQNLEDNKYDFLGVSLPPRVGKLISDDTDVLTTGGWKKHGDLRVGDFVYNRNGNPIKIIQVHPKDCANKRVFFTNGVYIDCHENHEWIVIDKTDMKEKILETKAVREDLFMKQRGRTCFRYQLPFCKKIGDSKHSNEVVSIASIQDIESKPGNCITVEGGEYRVGKKLILTHNSTMCIFFMSWIMGKRPNSHNAMSGHSGILADGFYNEILNLVTTQEYTFGEIFPRIVSKQIKTSAEKMEINMDRPDRFATLTCRGIDGTWTGAVDISSDGYLYVDDLVRDRTESLSAIRLEKRYQDYLNVLVDRKNDGTRELMVGTRWNVIDPLGRVETRFKDNPRYKFLKIPALDENNESNFNYDYGVGFSTKYYTDMKMRLDANEWQAKYQQKPFVRELHEVAPTPFEETDLYV